jgi:hypothetical protein
MGFSLQFADSVFELVKREQIETAIEAVLEEVKRMGWRHDQFFPQLTRGDVYAALTARPKIFAAVPDQSMIFFQRAAVMAFLGLPTSRSRWLPPGLQTGTRINGDSAVGAIVNYVQSQRNIECWVKSGLVINARLQNASRDVCPNCAELSHVWLLGEQPELPYEFCTNPKGCHCVYIAHTFREHRAPG